MKTPSERSDGARRERKAMRAYLRRQMVNQKIHFVTAVGTLGIVMRWVLKRQVRYDQRVGGLGRK